MIFNRMKKNLSSVPKNSWGKGTKRWFTAAYILLSPCSQEPRYLLGSDWGGDEDGQWWCYNFLSINHIANLEAKILTLDTVFMDECFEVASFNDLTLIISLSPKTVFTE